MSEQDNHSIDGFAHTSHLDLSPRRQGLKMYWNNDRHRRLANSVFAQYGVPLELLRAPGFDEDPDDWHFDLYGAELDAVIDQMRNVQSEILKRFVASEGRDVGSRDALFMYMSQWFELILGPVPDADEERELAELMELVAERWLTLYLTRRPGFFN